jgi:hypothetical protein
MRFEAGGSWTTQRATVPNAVGTLPSARIDTKFAHAVKCFGNRLAAAQPINRDTFPMRNTFGPGVAGEMDRQEIYRLSDIVTATFGHNKFDHLLALLVPTDEEHGAAECRNVEPGWRRSRPALPDRV